MERNVPVLLQLLVPGKSRHRSTPITACRTQRRSAPSFLGATRVATVQNNYYLIVIIPFTPHRLAQMCAVFYLTILVYCNLSNCVRSLVVGRQHSHMHELRSDLHKHKLKHTHATIDIVINTGSTLYYALYAVTQIALTSPITNA